MDEFVNQAAWKDFLENHRNLQAKPFQTPMYQFLRHGDWERMERGTRIMQTMILPSFKDSLSYEIFRTRGLFREEPQFTHSLVRTMWKGGESSSETLDDKKFEYKHAFIEEGYMKQLIQEIENIQIPAWSSTALWRGGNDGTIYELMFGTYLLQVRYSWWRKPFEEAWHPLHEYLLKRKNEFEELLGKPE